MMDCTNMLCTLIWLVIMFGEYIAQPEYTTPGGILSTNCLKGCTEVAVHESNCYPPCNNKQYERCVLVPRHVESSCRTIEMSARLQAKRSYDCRCYPCLFRGQSGVCVPVCPTVEEEA